MRFAIVLLAICTLCGPPARSSSGDSVSSGADAASIAWHRDDGTEVWVTPLKRPSAGAGSPLRAPRWYPKLPLILADSIDGVRVDFATFGGQVVLIDFWASWCTPCAVQLPQLQSFYDAERDNGLVVLTFHADETDEVARRFAQARDVTLPIARVTDDVRDAFRVSGLPTVVVADRAGNVRGRFTTGAASAKERLEQLVRELLDESEDPGLEIAEWVSGEGLLSVRWSREGAESVQGLSVLRQIDPPERRVVAATGWGIVGYGAGGESWLTRQVGPGVDRLRHGDGAAGDPMLVYGFRPAGERVVHIDLDGEEDLILEAPARVLDLRVEPIRYDGPRGLLLATIDGLHRVGLDGSSLETRADLGLVVDLAGTAGQTLALGGDGKLRRLDHELNTTQEWQTPPGSRRLVSVPELVPGVGLAPASVLDSAAGRLLEGDGKQLALALEDQLLLVDLDTGRELLRARWPGIAALAADDLDGDGRTELIVGSGKRVTVLTSR
jgi:thiol-disulfide isomerase/thioredoxin